MQIIPLFLITIIVLFFLVLMARVNNKKKSLLPMGILGATSLILFVIIAQKLTHRSFIKSIGFNIGGDINNFISIFIELWIVIIALAFIVLGGRIGGGLLKISFIILIIFLILSSLLLQGC